MNARINRRVFTLSLASSCVALDNVLGDEIYRADTFCGQSGACHSKEFIIAALTTSDASNAYKEIAKIRIRTKYKRLFESRSSDKFKIPFCREFMKAFELDDTYSFCAGYVHLENWPDASQERDTIRAAYHEKLFAAALPRLISKYNITMTSYNHVSQNVLISSLRKSLYSDPRIFRREVIQDELLQISSFFAGCIRADRVGSTSPARLAAIAAVKDALGVPKLDVPHLKGNKRFKIIDIFV